jgi:hypothetical protein
MMNVTVDQYKISADAADTVRSVLGNIGDTARGRRLSDAMRDMRQSQVTAYIVPAWETIRPEDYLPENPRFDSADPYGSEVQSLVEAGFAESFDILHEDSSSTYLDEGRVMTGVRVLRDFVIQHVNYTWSADANFRLARYGHSYADGWSLGYRSAIVKAGVYVIGETGDFRMDLVGASFLGEDCDPESLFYTIMEDEDFGASRASAGCSADEGHRWDAESGSWHFSGEYADGSAPDFDFDDADDFDADETFACPVEGCSGRVGVSVY